MLLPVSRLHCIEGNGMEEVVGSIPTRSTIKSTTYSFSDQLHRHQRWIVSGYLGCKDLNSRQLAVATGESGHVEA